MRTQLKTLALTGLLAGILLAPALAMAQAPGGRGAPRPGTAPRGDNPRGDAHRGNAHRGNAHRGNADRDDAPPPAVTHILNARRQLDLTARQVAQLDSMERVLWSARERVRAQAEPQRDSLRASMRQQMERGARPRPDSATRESMRREGEARMARVRPQMDALRQRDSTTRVAAERILTDGQRTTLREMQAERRGYERGRRAGGMGEPSGRQRGGRKMRPGQAGRPQNHREHGRPE